MMRIGNIVIKTGNNSDESKNQENIQDKPQNQSNDNNQNQENEQGQNQTK